MVAVALRPRAEVAIVRAIQSRRRAFAARLRHRLDEFFARQAGLVLARLYADEHLHRYETLKALPPGAASLLPPEDDRLLSMAIQPYLEAGTMSFAELAALMAGGTFEQPGVAVGRELSHAGSRIVQINEATRRAVQDALQEANMRGYNLYQIAHGVPADAYRGLDSTVRQLYRGRSEAIARTEIGNASQHAAHAQWNDMGVGFVKIQDGVEWDDECRARNGRIVPASQHVGLNHPNAVLGGSTFVPYGGLLYMMRARYDGPAVRLSLSGSHHTTIGPNHPVLTRRGFVAARDLHEGDECVYDLRHDDPMRFVKPHFQQMPTLADCFETFQSVGSNSRVASSADDFHGDGAACHGEVEVVSADRPLLFKLDAPLDEELRERDLVGADAEAHLVASSRTRELGGERILLSASRGVRGGDVQSVGASHWRFLPVLSAEHVRWAGWAYDAMTKSSLYCTDGLVVSNCTVVSIPVVGSHSAQVLHRVGGGSGEEILPHQIRSQDADQWLSDSANKDESYHWTSRDRADAIEKEGVSIAKASPNSMLGQGFYTSTSPTAEAMPGGRAVRTAIRTKNPLRLNNTEATMRSLASRPIGDETPAQAMRRELLAEGHDAVIVEWGSGERWIVALLDDIVKVIV